MRLYETTITAAGYTTTITAGETGTGGGDSFKTIAVSGQSNVVADSATDTLTLVAGSGMTITTNATTDTITFASSGGSGVSDGDKGDITVSSSGATWTIDTGVVTLAKMANMATSSLIYRKTAGTGAPEVNTLATLKTDLGLSGTNSGDQDLSGYAQLNNNTQDIIAGSISLYDSITTGDVVLQVSDGVLQVGATPVNPNATHTGEVTGSGALTVDKTAITGKTLVSAAVGDHVLVADASDSDNLKKVTVQTIVDLASGTGSVGTDTIWDAVGDLAVGSGANTASRLAMGTALQQLRVNAGATGLEWATISGSGTPTAITVADTNDTTCFVALFESATGDLGPKTDGGLTYNASTGVLTATGFSGPLTGNVTGNASGTAATFTGSLTGDVTSTAMATTIANDAVTYAKMQNVSAASKLLGRGDSGSGDVQEITLGSGLTMTGTTISSSGGSSLVHGICQGRLTTETGVAISSTDQANRTTIYFTPYNGNKIALYSGSAWAESSFTERSLALSGLTSGKNYDVFIYDNSGTITLELSAAWTNDTTRADALTTQDGILVKSGSTTRRYLGTIRATSATETQDTVTKRYVWNAYNKVAKKMSVTGGGVGHTYASTTARYYNNDSAIKIEFVIGQTETVDVQIYASGAADYMVGVWPIDTASGTEDFSVAVYGISGGSTGGCGKYVLVTAGYHFFGLLERSVLGATGTYYEGTMTASVLG